MATRKNFTLMPDIPDEDNPASAFVSSRVPLEDMSLYKDKVVYITINNITDHPKHTYKVIDDAKMDELVESIEELGVVEPILVRKIDDKYECISGHRRKHAALRAGLSVVPAVILDVDDDVSDVLMVDSNNQREKISISEKAKSYKVKYEAIKRSSKLNFESFSDYKASQLISGESEESYKTVMRYIKIAELPEEYLKALDEGNLTFRAAFQLSGMNNNELNFLYKTQIENDVFPTEKESKELKMLSENKIFNEDNISATLNKPINTEYENKDSKNETSDDLVSKEEQARLKKEIAKMKQFNAATKDIFPKDIDKYCPLENRKALLQELVDIWYREQIGKENIKGDKNDFR